MPLHFIDTGILLETLKDTELSNICSGYLNKVGYKYRGILCLSVLGEFFLVTFRDVKEQEIRGIGFEFLDRFVRRKKAGLSALKYESFRIVDRIKELDSRVEDTDAIHLANCIQDGGSTFVTFDEKLVDNVKLESEFKIRIIHPKDL